MLTQVQAENAVLTVRECISHICQNRRIGAGKEERIVPIHEPSGIAVIGKMLCEALNSMQDEVRFHAIKLPSRTEGEELLAEIDKIVFKDTAPDDYEFPEDEEKQHKRRGGA